MEGLNILSIFRSITWIAKKLLLFAVLIVTMVAIVYLPVTVGATGSLSNYRIDATGYRLDGARWVKAVESQFKLWLRGKFVPTEVAPGRPAPTTVQPTTVQPDSFDTIRKHFGRSLPTTLGLFFAALVTSALLGTAVGIGISRVGPRWLRWPLWSLTTATGALPDILVAVAVDMGLYFFGDYTGFQWTVHPSTGPLPIKNYISPWLGLTLIGVPLIARTTAAAIEEVSAQYYVRSAVSKGLPPTSVLFKHIGRNALIRVWAVMPVVVGILLSSIPIVEYMTSTPGLGQALIEERRSSMAICLDLIPFVVTFMVLTTLFDLGQRLLDPRQREAKEEPALWDRSRWGRLPVAARGFVHSLADLPGQLVRLPVELAYTLWEWLKAIPRMIVGALRSLRDPVLLAGTLLTLGLIAVAIFAPKLAPYPPEQQFRPYQDAFAHVWANPMAPHATHLMGTDDLGRDTYSRLIYGTRYALLLAAMVTPMRFLAAALLGALAARGRGIWLVLLRWLSTAFAAVPAILVPLMGLPLINMYFENTLPRVALWLGAVFVTLPGVPRLAEAVRRLAEEARNQPYVEGARAVGAGAGRTLFRYILPELSPQLVTLLALEIPAVMAMTFTLGYYQVFLGGALHDSQTYRIIGSILPEWGASLQQPPIVMLVAGHWWMITPLLALVVAVASFSLLAEGLRRRWRSRTGWQWGG